MCMYCNVAQSRVLHPRGASLGFAASVATSLAPCICCRLQFPMPPKKPPKGTPPNDSPAPDASTRKNASDTELKDKELKQLKELKKNGDAKGKAQPKAVAEPKALSKLVAAKKRTKKVGSGSPLAQNLLSALALVAAVGATYYLTSRPTPSQPLKPPRVDPKRPVPVTQDGVEDQSWVRDECQSWAEDGECENNPALMKQRCPGKCKAKAKAKPAKAKTKKSAEDEGPPDKSPHCSAWAAAGECANNAAFMLGECAASCRGGGKGKSTSVDMNQDCTPWVSDGECYRNPAFMLQQCKASCEVFAEENEGILQDTSDTCVNFALQGSRRMLEPQAQPRPRPEPEPEPRS